MATLLPMLFIYNSHTRLFPIFWRCIQGTSHLRARSAYKCTRLSRDESLTVDRICVRAYTNASGGMPSVDWICVHAHRFAPAESGGTNTQCWSDSCACSSVCAGGESWNIQCWSDLCACSSVYAGGVWWNTQCRSDLCACMSVCAGLHAAYCECIYHVPRAVALFLFFSFVVLLSFFLFLFPRIP